MRNHKWIDRFEENNDDESDSKQDKTRNVLIFENKFIAVNLGHSVHMAIYITDHHNPANATSLLFRLKYTFEKQTTTKKMMISSRSEQLIDIIIRRRVNIRLHLARSQVRLCISDRWQPNWCRAAWIATATKSPLIASTSQTWSFAAGRIWSSNLSTLLYVFEEHSEYAGWCGDSSSRSISRHIAFN